MCQMISVLTTPEEFKNATVTIDFGFVLKENNVIIKVPFSKRCVFKLFSVHTHTQKKNGIFIFYRFVEDHFRKSSVLMTECGW